MECPVGFSYSGWALSFFPGARLPDDVPHDFPDTFLAGLAESRREEHVARRFRRQGLGTVGIPLTHAAVTPMNNQLALAIPRDFSCSGNGGALGLVYGRGSIARITADD